MVLVILMCEKQFSELMVQANYSHCVLYSEMSQRAEQAAQRGGGMAIPLEIPRQIPEYSDLMRLF